MGEGCVKETTSARAGAASIEPSTSAAASDTSDRWTRPPPPIGTLPGRAVPAIAAAKGQPAALGRTGLTVGPSREPGGRR